MAYIDWDDAFSVGINSIDEQHKVLVGMINDFYENIKTRSNQENISILLRKMKEYTIVHFSTEEKYFKQYNFHDYEAHKKEHDDFVEKIIEVERKFNAGQLVLSFEITNFLKDWLRNHIQGTDMKYSNFLIEKGVV